MQDGASAHTSTLVKTYLSGVPGLNLLAKWPANSPDLNPLEGIWGEIKYSLQGKTFSSQDDLWNEVLLTWNSLKEEKFATMATSMIKRVKACIKAKGGHF